MMNLVTNKISDEKAFASALILLLSLGPVPTRGDVEKKAKGLAELTGYAGPLEAVIEESLVAIDTRMGIGTSLVNIEVEHDEDWVLKREYKRSITWKYSDRYEEYLLREKRSRTVVQSNSEVSKKILGHLQDPDSKGQWDRRGLVIGHVQSGKTSNYLGLIARAADAGYKFIIVIAGIHNNLRKQTQERIDEGFVGRSSDPGAREIIGVGLTTSNYPHPATLTNIHKDFNKQTAAQSGWRINDFSIPIVLVIKKNVSILTSLHQWLKELNTNSGGKISPPVLMIDDEADNASINTNKPELDPTRTNAMIRKILNAFDRSCYVGYTATPFANIFINHKAFGEDVNKELFPKDFIYCLDAPTNYFGPEKVFLDDESSETALEIIRDAEDYLPFSHKKHLEIEDLPPSLYDAIYSFILIRTIRNLRGHQRQHCSMMINVSRFVMVQRNVRDFINLFIKNFKESVKANYAMLEDVSRHSKHMIEIKRIFSTQFSNCEFDWRTVKTSLFTSFDHLRVFLINSKSDEALNYKKYEKDGNGLTAIAIGGLSLSRGLTIEGLSVSYMYRNTRMYDTLMQMGRWFGYRPGYEDLCRIYLSEDSINWYAHISEASEELRQQIKQMRKDRLSPEKFGLYVKSHPDNLLVTAANKMHEGTTIRIRQNFSGKIRESYLLSADEECNRKNRELIQKYWDSGFGHGKDSLKKTEKGWIVQDVNSEQVGQFLLLFRVHPDFVDQRNAHERFLSAISEKYPTCDVLFISPEDGRKVNKIALRTQARNTAKLSDTPRMWRTARYRVASRCDEKLGLPEEQKKEAEKLALEEDRVPSDRDYREIRNKPLLMLHLLDLGSKEKSWQANVPAYGISFPPGNYLESVEVVANKVWVDQVHGNTFADVDEEDDFDE